MEEGNNKIGKDFKNMLNKGLNYIKNLLVKHTNAPKENHVGIFLSIDQVINIVRELDEIENKTQEKYYIVYIRQYTTLLNDNVVYKKYIKTNDIYHYIGKYYSQALERVERIDYQEISNGRYEEGKDITYYKGKEFD